MVTPGTPNLQQRPPPEAEVPIEPGMRRALRGITLTGGLAAVVVGLVASVGWWVLGQVTVARFGVAEVAPVRPMAGLALLPAGVALFLLWRADVRGRSVPARAVRGFAAVILVVSLLGLVEVLTGWEIDPSSSLLDLRGTSDALPRGVAVALVVVAVALMLTAARDRAARLVAQALALLVMAVGLLLVLDFLLAWAFETVPRTYSPAMAATLVALGAGIASYRPAGGPIAVVASSLPSGALARRIGLAVLVTEPLLAVVAFWLHDREHVDAEAAFAGVAAATLALVVAATAVFATRLAPAEAARAEAEEEHRRTAARLRDLYDRAPTGYCSLDGEGHIREVNARLCEWLGRSRDALVGTSFFSVVTGDAEHVLREALALLRAGRPVAEIDLELVADRGTRLPVAFAATPVAGAANGTTIARVTVFDITDRRRADEQRLLAEHRYRTIVETALEGVASLDPGGRVLFANARLGELLGVLPDALIGRRLEELVEPEDRVAVAERRASRIAGDRSRQQFEVRFPRADGGTMWAIVSAAPEVAPDGSDRGTFATITDVTAWRSAEQARHEADRRYRTIVETAAEGLVLVGTDGVVTFANAQAERMVGLPPAGSSAWSSAGSGSPRRGSGSPRARPSAGTGTSARSARTSSWSARTAPRSRSRRCSRASPTTPARGSPRWAC